MVKLHTKTQGKEYLIDIYDTLCKDLRLDHEFFSIVDVVGKMYSYDTELATDWTFNLLNRYGMQGLRDYEMDFDSSAAIRSFIDYLMIDLKDNYNIGEIIKLIHARISFDSVRYFLWSYLFNPHKEKNKFIVYFDELVKKKQYSEAYDMTVLVIDHQGYIAPEIFDVVCFLNGIIEFYTEDEKIKDQQLLDLLYSLVDLIPTNFEKAILKSNFVDYL